MTAAGNTFDGVSREFAFSFSYFCDCLDDVNRISLPSKVGVPVSGSENLSYWEKPEIYRFFKIYIKIIKI